MAAAFTYRTIFGLATFFVLTLIVFNAFGGFKSVGQDIQTRIHDYLGLSSLALTQGIEDGQPRPDGAMAANQDLRANVQRIVDDLNEKVSSISFTKIGIAGLVVLIWAALSLVVTVEQFSIESTTVWPVAAGTCRS